MVLLDDNFATITNSVEEWRKLYDNLKKGVRYYLAVKLALIVIFLLPALFNVPLPFAPIQIILLELFMDLAASATFVIEPPESDVMKRKPRDPQARFLDAKMQSFIYLGALSLIAAVLSIYFLNVNLGQVRAQTMAFTAWMICHIFLALNMRTERDPLYDAKLTSNKMMLLWAAGVVATIFTIIYVPTLQDLFGVAPIGFMDWIIILGVSLVATFWIEVVKLISKKRM